MGALLYIIATSVYNNLHIIARGPSGALWGGLLPGQDRLLLPPILCSPPAQLRSPQLASLPCCPLSPARLRIIPPRPPSLLSFSLQSPSLWPAVILLFPTTHRSAFAKGEHCANLWCVCGGGGVGVGGFVDGWVWVCACVSVCGRARVSEWACVSACACVSRFFKKPSLSFLSTVSLNGWYGYAQLRNFRPLLLSLHHKAGKKQISGLTLHGPTKLFMIYLRVGVWKASRHANVTMFISSQGSS